MRTLAEEGNARAKKILAITDDSGKMISAILIGNNIVNLSASSIATTLAIKLFGNMGAGIGICRDYFFSDEGSNSCHFLNEHSVPCIFKAASG